MSDTAIGIFGIITCAALLAGYMIPTMVAYWRRHPQRLPIMAANTMLGWTIFVWAGLLAYAFWQFDRRALK